MYVKFNQYWDLISGREGEYREFIKEEFIPAMEGLGVEVVAGWYLLVGSGPHIVSEGLAKNLHEIEKAVKNPKFKKLITRLLNYVYNYSSKVLDPTGRIKKEPERIPRGVVKFNQSWNIRPGMEKVYNRFIIDEHVPTLEKLGIEVAGGWNVLIGSSPFLIQEGRAESIEAVARVLGKKEYKVILAKLLNLVTGYGSRILVPHSLFLEAIDEAHGKPIKVVAEDDIVSMYGPV